MRFGYRLVRTLARTVYAVLWRPRFIGRQHLPAGPYLLCANHRSWFDPPILSFVARREYGFLAKAELFDNRLFGRLIWFLNARPVRRGGIDRAAVSHVMDLLHDDTPVIVFPEGTRSRDGHMQPPRPGVGLLARLAGVPVVPVYISGSFRIGRAPFRWGRLSVHLGMPITSGEVLAFPDDKDGYRALSRLIMRRICDLSDDPARDWVASGGDPNGW